MCATVQERIHAIGAHCNPNISQINGKFKISRINVSPLCGISRMPSHQFWLLVYKPMLQMRNDRNVPKHLFRPTFSSVYVSVAVLITTSVFSTIE
jgi:hypothetical protein